MVLGGLALAFSRLIDNSVVVLENIYRHIELGETPEAAAEKGGAEVSLPVLAATLTTAIVFFPVTFLNGISRYLFTALALSVVLSLFASYLVAMTVVPLFCATSSSAPPRSTTTWRTIRVSWGGLTNGLTIIFHNFLARFDSAEAFALARPAATVIAILGFFIASLGLFPLVGRAYFPRADPGQFVINLKAAPPPARASRLPSRKCRRSRT